MTAAIVDALSTIESLPKSEQIGALLLSLFSKSYEVASLQNQEYLQQLTKTGDLVATDFETAFGNIAKLFHRPPKRDAERELAMAVGTYYVQFALRKEEDPEKVAEIALWLSEETAFDPFVGLQESKALSERFLSALANPLRDWDSPSKSHSGRKNAFASWKALVILAPYFEVAKNELERSKDPSFAFFNSSIPSHAASFELNGDLIQSPRPRFLTFILAITGLLFLKSAFFWFLRLALGYKRPVSLIPGKEGIMLSWYSEIMGKKLSEKEVLLKKSDTLSVARENKWNHATMYIGLSALAVGTFTGLTLLLDGIRAASGSLFGIGALVLVSGVLLDWALTIFPFSPKTKAYLSISGKKQSTLIVKSDQKECLKFLDAYKVSV